MIEPGRGLEELNQYALKLAAPLRASFLADATFHQRSYAAHFLTRNEYVLRLECAVAEIVLRQPEHHR